MPKKSRPARTDPLAGTLSERADAPKPGATGTGLEAELATLQRLSLDELRLRWRNHWGRLAPAHLPRNLLFRLMAYRLQAEAFGDLDGRTVRLLDRLTDRAANKPSSDDSSEPAGEDVQKTGGAVGGSPRQPSETLVLKPGAVLTREWHSRIERVMVANNGFVWGGATYASLSAVAFAITGTKWNGLRFFGVRLRDRSRASGPQADEERNCHDAKRHPFGRRKPAERSPKGTS
jgi:hypothetical protein